MSAAAEFDALRASPADYAAQKAEVLAGRRRPRQASVPVSAVTPLAVASDTATRLPAPPPAVPSDLDAMTASAADYAARKAELVRRPLLARGRVL